MGFLNIFSKRNETSHLVRLPSGSFTVDAQGRIVASTVPRSFPEARVKEIAAQVLAIFQNAKKAELPLTELVVQFSALKISAREMRGGAIIFLAPETLK